MDIMDDFMQKIEKHRNEFYRYIHRTVWDSGVADDVFSAAVLAAWENKHKFTPGTNFRAWMYKIITNKCYVANRNIQRTPSNIEDVPETAFLEVHQSVAYRPVLEDPEHVLEECSSEVLVAVQNLSDAQRDCLLLRSIEKFSYKEIAEVLDIPVGTVMTHLSRGRAKLRLELTDYARQQGIIRKMPRIVGRDEQDTNAETA
jgi:RNA polymerase sigma-70 factor (ECF subfamily)